MPDERLARPLDQGRKNLLYPVGEVVISFVVPRLPTWIGTRTLTLTTLLWCVMVLGIGWSARDEQWQLSLLGIPILGQYLTDVLDGEVGRVRRSGWVRWGYYMDHVLDYCFLATICSAYFFYLQPSDQYLAFIAFIAASGIMVHCFLLTPIFDALPLQVWRIGPSEARLGVIVANLVAPLWGSTVVVNTMRISTGASLLFFAVLVVLTQVRLRDMDRTSEH